MKKTLLLIFFLVSIQFAQSQDSTNVVTMAVDYIELDSVTIQKKITYTYPSGEKMIREFKSLPDSIFVIRELEEINRLFEERQRLAEEVQRLILEIQAIDVYLSEADTKYKAIDDKYKLKDKDK